MPEPIVIAAIISAVIGLTLLCVAALHGFRLEREKHQSGTYQHERRAPRHEP